MEASAAPATPAIVDVGDLVPDLSLADDRGTMVNLREAARDATLILFFYPRDGGIRCKTQACALRDSWPLLRSEGVEVYGVNHQDAESHARFRTQSDLPFPLLVDADLRLARAFGFVREWMPPPISPLERSTVIVDPGGRIRVVLRKVKPTAHFDLLRVNLNLPLREPDRQLVDEPGPAATDTPAE